MKENKLLSGLMKVSVGIMLLGLVLLIVGFIGTGGNFSEIRAMYNIDDRYEAVNQEEANEVTGLYVTGVDERIVIQKAAVASISMDYYEAENDRFDYSVVDGILTLKKQTRPFWRNINITPSWRSSALKVITITVPNDYNGTINFKTTNGSIVIDNFQIEGSITLVSTNGKVEIKNSSATEAISLKTTNGDVVMQHVSTPKSINATTTNGRIQISNLSALSMKLTTTNGSVTAARLQADNVELSTTNGGVTLLVIGNEDDYKVDVRTTNGSINYNGLKIASQVLRPNAENTLRLRTTNGGITLSIQPE